nr:tetratricopeptide repeat protein [uncultured Desulfobulbus sp.]
MSEPTAFDSNNLKMQPLGPPEGLLDQFNLPPKMIAFIRRNQRALWAAFILVVVVSLGVAGFNAYREHREQQAASALDAAILAPTDNAAQLQKVVAEYGSTESGLWARVELAALEEKAGRSEEALAAMERINAGLGISSSLKPLLLSKLAALYENNKQLDKALALYAELATYETFSAEAYRSLGRVNEQLGKKEDAVAMYGKYLDSENGQSRPGQANPVREMVQTRLNQLKK